MIVVPIVVCVVCFVTGVVVAARWLPDLAHGAVGGLAFLTVCGLIGVALSLAGLNVYEIVEFRGLGDGSSLVLVAGGLVSLLRDSGTTVGVAMIVYLLAPAARQDASGESAEGVRAGGSHAGDVG